MCCIRIRVYITYTYRREGVGAGSEKREKDGGYFSVTIDHRDYTDREKQNEQAKTPNWLRVARKPPLRLASVDRYSPFASLE